MASNCCGIIWRNQKHEVQVQELSKNTENHAIGKPWKDIKSMQWRIILYKSSNKCVCISGIAALPLPAIRIGHLQSQAALQLQPRKFDQGMPTLRQKKPWYKSANVPSQLQPFDQEMSRVWTGLDLKFETVFVRASNWKKGAACGHWSFVTQGLCIFLMNVCRYSKICRSLMWQQQRMQPRPLDRAGYFQSLIGGGVSLVWLPQGVIVSCGKRKSSVVALCLLCGACSSHSIHSSQCQEWMVDFFKIAGQNNVSCTDFCANMPTRIRPCSKIRYNFGVFFPVGPGCAHQWQTNSENTHRLTCQFFRCQTR